MIAPSRNAKALIPATLVSIDVLRLLPPLIFERAHVDEAIEKLGQALRS